MSTVTSEKQAKRPGSRAAKAQQVAHEEAHTLYVRPRHARLDATSLATLADVAEQFGEGRLYLNPRAKLQLRHVHDVTAATNALQAAGLLESPEHAALPDRVISPATDLDPYANASAETLTQAIEAHMLETGLTVQPANQLIIAIDGGGLAHIGTNRAHIRLESMPGKTGHWRISLVGTVATATVLGATTKTDAPAVVCRLIKRFLATDTNFRRLRDLSADALKDRFGGCGEWPTSVGDLERPSGPLVGPQDGRWQVAGFMFGRMDSHTLRQLSKLVDATPAGDIRLTPYRSIILSGDDDHTRQNLAELGAIVDLQDQRLSMVACMGNEGCPLGSTNTRDDALACLPAIPSLQAAAQNKALHVSGCAKGCDWKATATITLVGRQGLYNVVFANTPMDKPTWRALSLDEVKRRLQHLDQAFAHDGLAGESSEAFLHRLGSAGIDEATIATGEGATA